MSNEEEFCYVDVGDACATKIYWLFPDEFNTAMYREAAALRRLHHPHIIAPILLSAKEDSLEIELPLGRAVKELCYDSVANNLSEIARFIAHVAAGLAHAHTQGVAHRDIKPENVVYFCDSERYAVIDWGSAGFGCTEKLPRSTWTHTRCFHPPEVLDPAAGIFDHRTGDVWSLGISVLSLFADIDKAFLAGTEAHYFECTKRLARRAAERKLAEYFNVDIPGELQDLLSKMLCEDPERRITAKELCACPLVRKACDTQNRRATGCAAAGDQELQRRAEREYFYYIDSPMCREYNYRDVTLRAAASMVARVTAILGKPLKRMSLACLALADQIYDDNPLLLKRYARPGDSEFAATIMQIAVTLDWALAL